MLIDERLEIETPEGTLLTLSLAGPVPRAMAYGIDLLIRLVIFALIAFLVGAFGNVGTGVILISLFLLEWFYPTLFEAFRNGQTPGKKFMGIAVVHSNGTPLSFNGSLIRNLLRTADAFPLFYLLGFVTTLISPRFQRLGDMAANSVVIHVENTATAVKADQGTTTPPDWPLGRDDQLALLAFQERHSQFSEPRQQELAQLAYPELSPPLALQRLRSVTRYLLEGAK
ncbi:RDD family protein [Alcanivorax sp. S6407]|uniref:RDD family protein n=1 Tax=Alcanivorax sp. S6407 TaxID=2926424 RepID=UPI001FF32A32|nr:RDD family protein [Alcanivorax sp. S6407]MCK0152213.1 RDD family protein [Alcanivorax sp. S6407]